MQQTFEIPRTLYNALIKAAEQKGQTLEKYLDELMLALVCGELR